MVVCRGSRADGYTVRDVDLTVELRASFSPDELSVARARRFVRDALDGRVGAGLHADVVLAAGELATNASVHAGTPFSVLVSLGADGVRLEVTDGVATLPAPRLDDGADLTASGLHLLAAVARRWGATPSPGGKVVWAEFDR